MNLQIDDLQAAVGNPYPLVVGILNVTPDSFSGDGLADAPDLLGQAHKLVSDGATILDIGGESTRPGSQAVPLSEELRRLLQIVPLIAQKVFVSVDTYKAAVAEEMLRAGARMINDVSALRADPALAAVVARYNAFVVLMYSKEEDDHPHATFAERHYTDVVAEIAAFLRKRIDFACAAGIARNRILIDPGMGRFISHDPAYSFQVINELARLREFGITQPIMVGVSRKGFLLKGEADTQILDRQSQLLALKALQNGATLIRTHNVELARQVITENG